MSTSSSVGSPQIPSSTIRDKLNEKAGPNKKEQALKAKIENEDLAERFRNVSINKQDSQIFSYYWASLARTISIDSTDTLCTAVFVHKGTLYYAAKNFNADNSYTAGQKSENSRMKILNMMATFLNVNRDNKEKQSRIIKSTLWTKTRPVIEKKILQQSSSITKLKNFENQLYKDVATKFLSWQKDLQKLPSPPTNFAEIAALRSSADDVRSAVVEMLRGASHNAKSHVYREAPRYLEVVLYFYDYLKLTEDIDKFISEGDSHLATAWSAIKNKKFEDCSTNSHVELSIVGKLLSSEAIQVADLPAIFSAACLTESKKNNPLVASLWNCYGCWNIINCGSEAGVHNLNKEVGVICPSSEQLLIKGEWIKNDKDNNYLERLQKCVDESIDKLCQEDVKLVESRTWIQHQNMLY